MANPSILPAAKHHAAFVAWLSLAAARSHLPRGFWDFFLAQGDAEILRYLEAQAQTRRPHPFHHSAFLIAEIDGRPAAGLCGFFEEEGGFKDFAAVSAEVDAALGRPPGAGQAGMARMGAFMAVVPEHRPGAWIVENVATLPELRRRGLAGRLLDEILELGAARGASCAELSVFIGNDSARLAYEQKGFEVVSEKRSAELERTWGSPGLQLMRRPF